MTILLYSILVFGAAGLYVFMAGVIHELLSSWGASDERDLAAVLWPIAGPMWVVARFALLGPSLVKWLRRPRVKLPRAQVL